jgi:hypothetical protein
MGQLDVYSLEDISLITIMAGPISTYLSEEIEVSIESVVAYVYSANFASKKRSKLVVVERPAGELIGAIYKSWNLVALNSTLFWSIYRPIDRRVMWQDPAISQWEGKADRANLARLDSRYKW